MTATEWLFKQINNTLIDYTEGKISASVYGVRLTEHKYKAKEMEREQQERVVNMALLNNTFSQTEISDEEIEQQSYKLNGAMSIAFEEGAKWYREKLKLKNNS